jgi:predicted RNase H-like HicB family nuclease
MAALFILQVDNIIIPLYILSMAVHEEVLSAAIRLCSSRQGWRFRPVEIVRALPHCSPGSVRTHVVSRCCTNAPTHHPHKWDYFERVERGVYEIRPRYRRRKARQPTVAEPAATYGKAEQARRREVIHAAVSESGPWYVAECLEVAVVTQGRTLDELVANLREAVDLHLEGEDPGVLGLVAAPRIALSYELGTRPH